MVRIFQASGKGSIRSLPHPKLKPRIILRTIHTFSNNAWDRNMLQSDWDEINRITMSSFSVLRTHETKTILKLHAANNKSQRFLSMHKTATKGEVQKLTDYWRLRLNYAGGIWKLSLIFPVRPWSNSVHTNPSRKRRNLKTPACISV